MVEATGAANRRLACNPWCTKEMALAFPPMAERHGPDLPGCLFAFLCVRPVACICVVDIIEPDGGVRALTIVKGLVEALGGRVWVESEPARGCRFQFTLPASRHGGVADDGIQEVA